MRADSGSAALSTLRELKAHLRVSGPFVFFQRKCSSQPGDAAADDGNASHDLRLCVPEADRREPEGEYSCTSRARFFTFSTGVSGRMPWPRLKM